MTTHDLEALVHHQVMASMIQTGRSPTIREIAHGLSMSLEEVASSLEKLAANHGVVLHPHHQEPWVMHPFSMSPTATWIENGSMGWWAPCMWCACGIATLVGTDTTIHTRIAGEHEDVDIHIHDGRVVEDDLYVHFAVPPRAAWDNVHHFCSTVLAFRSPADVPSWCIRHGMNQGAIVPIANVMVLGREWYARHAQPDWRKWTVEEARTLFRKAGLEDEFWSLPFSGQRF